jgi:acyl-CoA synthetase (NDP forming)/GNAT superfamily N-acetyltransferase
MSEPPGQVPPTVAGPDVYALLSDGTTVLIRPARADDFDAVKAMHEAMSPANAYLRFFSLSRTAPEREARRVSRGPGPDHAALLAFLGDQVIGVASYEVQPGTLAAEVAFAVAETMHHRGIATLLLEHLVSMARARGLSAFTAETLSENTSMLRVFNDAGLPTHSRRDQGTVEITIPLPSGSAGRQPGQASRGGPPGTGRQLEEYLDTVAARERSANVASLRPVFAPRSVAVIGASRRTGTIGRSILDNIVAGGYQGALYAVNRNASEIGGVACFPSVAALPEAPDLALIAVPPKEVLHAAEDCGVRGAKGVVVITADLDAAESAELLTSCRRHGMRLLGPNGFGVAVPAIGLEATFAATTPADGVAGLVMQSGGLGFALVEHLSRLGIGISSFASVGNKLDVSSNDMLMWWEQDGVTRLAVLYIESFGNPRKFARTARRVGRQLPVLTVHAGRSEAGQRAAASHTAAVATPLVTREALFEQAGIIATPSFGELLEATALLAAVRPPAGRTVAIVSNVGGAGVLAADACTDLGLTVHHPGSQTRNRIRELAPEGGSVAGPVDTSATVTVHDFRRVLELVSADEEVDAIIALVLPTRATGDLTSAIRDASVSVPMAAVVLDQPEAVRLLDGRSGRVPAYCYPEAAAAALARATTYGEWRGRRAGDVMDVPDVDLATARELIGRFLSASPGVPSPEGGWLSRTDGASVLGCYGIPLADGEQAARRLAAGGTEVLVRVEDDNMFGPLVVFGLDGAAARFPEDRVARLTPLTEDDADAMLASIRSAALLRGYRGGPAADRAALRDLLLRVSRMSDDLPEIAELDLSPVIAGPDGVVVAGARIRVTPQAPQDPFLRRLRLRPSAAHRRRDREVDQVRALGGRFRPGTGQAEDGHRRRREAGRRIGRRVGKADGQFRDARIVADDQHGPRCLGELADEHQQAEDRCLVYP